MNAHTPGPWRWEYRPKDKTTQLCGGARPYDLTVMDFTRVGMSNAGPRFMDGSDCQILYRLCDRPDWVTPLPNREHHAHWITAVTHPDALLIATAPDLLALAHQYASECGDCAGTRVCPDDEPCTECADIWRVIDKAEGRA